jgi:hypothetical protein
MGGGSEVFLAADHMAAAPKRVATSVDSTTPRTASPEFNATAERAPLLLLVLLLLLLLLELSVLELLLPDEEEVVLPLALELVTAVVFLASLRPSTNNHI